MEPERWEEYLKANPNAKVFRTKPLQFPKEMVILFGGTMATSEAAWTPAFGTIPDDMLRMPLENHNLSFASNPMTPQSSNFQEEDQEIGLEDQLEVRRKRPCPSRRKKNSGNDALVVSIDNLFSSIWWIGLLIWWLSLSDVSLSFVLAFRGIILLYHRALFVCSCGFLFLDFSFNIIYRY